MANYYINNHDEFNNVDINEIIQFGSNKKKWKTLKHNGVLFPPEYIKHNVPVIYEGSNIVLDSAPEEYATLYAKHYDSDYIKSSVFRKNFWKDWKKVLGKDHIIQNLESCDFKLINDYLISKREEKKILTPEEKEKEKKIKDEYESKFKTAIVDGVEQEVGNFRMEPPSIFLGRGCNPKLGKLKKRIYPEDVIINIGEDEQIPETLEGHKWGKVIHNTNSEWLAAWKDTITGKIKYLWLGATSELKAKSDKEKFDMARKLKRKIKTIRAKNDLELNSNDSFMRQLSTALYFIDIFALRVGNEKGADTADTVGTTSLRVEHIKFLDDNKIELDFLGKDSVRYKKVLPVDERIYRNLKEFTKNKSDDDQLFDEINAGDVNKYLRSFMPNLTAKVFRTMNASALFQKELNKISNKYENYEEDDKVNVLLDEFNKANAKVAMLCNHQKNINKSNNKQIDNINEMIKKQRRALRKARKSGKKNLERIEMIEQKIKKLKARKEMKIELKNVSLGTSLQNYIDPRLVYFFTKKHGIDINKIFTKVLQDKFKWAQDVDENFKF